MATHRRLALTTRQTVLGLALAMATLAVFIVIVAWTSTPVRFMATCNGSVPYGLAYATTDPVFGDLVCPEHAPAVPPAQRTSLLSAREPDHLRDG